MRPRCVVFHSPFLDNDLRFLQRVKNLSVQAFIPQFPVETLAVTVLPRTPRLNVPSSRSQIPQPLPKFPSHELRSVVRSNVLWNSSPQHHISQRLDDLITPKSSSYTDRQTLPRVFIDHRQHADHSAIVGHGTHEIVAPHVIRPLRPYSVSWAVESGARLYLFVEGQNIGLSVDESFSRIPHSLTPEERARQNKNLYVYAPQWDFIPTGNLCLSIVNVPYEIQNFRKTWREGTTRNVEDCLSDFLSVLPYLAKAMEFVDQERKLRLQQQQEREKRAEEMRVKREEYRRKTKIAEQFLEDWSKSKAFNALADAITGVIETSQLQVEQQEKLKIISNWIARHAENINPLAQIDSIILKFNESRTEFY
jgi:hypothetical protein